MHPLTSELTADVDVWVRNIPNKENAFSLPMPGGKHFYLDFIAHLKDGRVLVVEYKGDSLVTADDAKKKSSAKFGKEIAEEWDFSSWLSRKMIWGVVSSSKSPTRFFGLLDQVDFSITS